MNLATVYWMSFFRQDERHVSGDSSDDPEGAELAQGTRPNFLRKKKTVDHRRTSK